MAEKRLVIVQDADFFKAKKKPQPSEEETSTVGEEAIISYLDNPSPTTCLIFLADEGIDKRKKIY
ncbi:MAG TPA: DNA polymerase III subunit delta, partial [Bacillota bacterium]|nr:DNA polymerase III subunit delta [Bacillota bacterium]